jgi:hypothetical protein
MPAAPASVVTSVCTGLCRSVPACPFAPKRHARVFVLPCFISRLRFRLVLGRGWRIDSESYSASLVAGSDRLKHCRMK